RRVIRQSLLSSARPGTESSRVGLSTIRKAGSSWRIPISVRGIGGPRCRPGDGTCLSAIGEGDVQFEDGAIVLIIQGYMHLIPVDGYVLADHVDDFLLQLRQVIGLTALATFMGNNDLQA